MSDEAGKSGSPWNFKLVRRILDIDRREDVVKKVLWWSPDSHDGDSDEDNESHGDSDDDDNDDDDCVMLRWVNYLAEKLPARFPFLAVWEEELQNSEHVQEQILVDVGGIAFFGPRHSHRRGVGGKKDAPPADTSGSLARGKGGAIYFRARVLSKDENEVTKERLLPAHQVRLFPGDDPEISSGMTAEAVGEANEALDQLDFFLNYLWFPWDAREERKFLKAKAASAPKEWSKRHLFDRIGVIRNHLECSSSIARALEPPKAGAGFLASMVQMSARYLELEERADQLQVALENCSDSFDEELLVEKYEIERELEKISAAATLLEDDTLRCALHNVKQKRRLRAIVANHGDRAPANGFACAGGAAGGPVVQVHMVFAPEEGAAGMTFYSLNSFLTRSQKVVEDAHSSISSSKTLNFSAASLPDALDAALLGDIVVLNVGQHTIETAGRSQPLADVYVLGVDPEQTVIDLKTPPGLFGVTYVADSSFAVLENLRFTAASSGASTCAINGIYVCKGGTLTMRRCEMFGFNCAIRVAVGGHLVLKNSEVNVNDVAIVVEQGGRLDLDQVDIEGRSDGLPYHGLVFEDFTGNGITMTNVNMRMDAGHLVVCNPSQLEAVEVVDDVDRLKAKGILSKCILNNVRLGNGPIYSCASFDLCCDPDGTANALREKGLQTCGDHRKDPQEYNLDGVWSNLTW